MAKTDMAEAVCLCGLQKKEVDFHKLSRKWPMCACKQPMRVKSYTAPPPKMTAQEALEKARKTRWDKHRKLYGKEEE